MTAQLEIRRRARARCNSGWILEGETASYHQGRLISVADDGELIDETIGVNRCDDDPFIAALTSTLVSTPAEHHRAWLTVGLIKAVQMSSLRNAAVRWDEVVGG